MRNWLLLVVVILLVCAALAAHGKLAAEWNTLLCLGLALWAALGVKRPEL